MTTYYTRPNAAHAPLIYADAIELGLAFLRGQGAEASQEVCRRAVQEAHLDIVNAWDWPTLERSGRIHCHAAQTSSTVTYVHGTSGETRTLTLASGTWPTWAANGTLLIDSLLCEVEERVSDTVLRLDSQMNPGKDYAAGTSYSIFCRWYPLPDDFVNFTGPMGRSGWAYGQQISMTELAAYQRNYSTGSGFRYYAISQRPNVGTEKAIFVWPYAIADDVLDFTYNRRPRELIYSGYDSADMAGTISISSTANDVTGTNTSFEIGMIGAILLAGTTAAVPTGRYGLNRYVEWHRITSWTSVSSIETADFAAVTASGLKYRVTDPIDLEPCAQNAFMRFVDYHLARYRGSDKAEKFLMIARDALRDAMAAAYPVRYDPSQMSMAMNGPAWREQGTVDWGAPP
jgi:hypothetical protein